MQFFRNSVLPLAAVSLYAAVATGCGSGSGKNVKIDGIDGPKTTFVDGKFLMTVVFKQVQFDGGIRVPVPDMPNSYLEIAPDLASNGMLLAVAVDTKDIKFINDARILPPGTLPGGRPLPGVAEGRMPALAVQVPKLNNIAFYISEDIFGVFVPVKLGVDNAVATFRFYADNGKPIGNISIVGRDAEKKNSGFLLMVNLKSPTVAALMN